MQQTGLLIIGKVVKSVKFLDDGVEDRKEQRDWLHTGVPKMLVRLIIAASSNYSIVRECLKIAIEFLESGKLRRLLNSGKLRQFLESGGIRKANSRYGSWSGWSR